MPILRRSVVQFCSAPLVRFHTALDRRGLATATTARLSESLLGRVEHLGLNVKADNVPAIRCYQKLGYEIVASYNEYSLRKRPE